MRNTKSLATIAALVVAGCADDTTVENPAIEDLLGDARDVGDKADFVTELSAEITEDRIRFGVAELRLTGELAVTVFDVLDRSDLYEEEAVGDVGVVRAPSIDCAANASEAVCLATVFAAGAHPTEVFFYAPDRPNAPQSIAAAMALMPEVEVIDPLETKQIGRLACMAANPPALGVPDICHVQHPEQ